jgi:hypothetical protein
VVDPTNELLEQLSNLESRIPWIPLGLSLLVLLWIPSLTRLASEDLHPAEAAWLQEVIDPPEEAGGGSAFSRHLTRVAWERWPGTTTLPVDFDAGQRRALRIPAALGYIAGIVVFYVLSRLVVGNAGGLLAATLLTISAPWVRAGTSALPLILGETLILVGVLSALVLQARHREVEVAGATAKHIGIAGIFLGVGLLLAPAGVATFLTILLIWFFLAIRRSSSEATTLPVEHPRQTVFFAVFGTIVLVGASAVTAWGVERIAGGSGVPFASLLVPMLDEGIEIWRDLFRGILSPGPATDLVVFFAIPLIVVVRVLEWSDGRPWRAGGLLPWIFLGLYFSALRGEHGASQALQVPVTVPPLFVLGLGWIVLRGLRPGRTRRQEYTFLITWLAAGLALIPFVPGGTPHDPLLAGTVTLLPAVILIAGRAGRALWEAEETPLARIGILIIVYLPIVLFGVAAIAGSGPLQTAADALQDHIFGILLGAVALGVISEMIHVRPDVAPAIPSASSRRRFRRGRPRGDRRRPRRPGRSTRRSP